MAGNLKYTGLDFANFSLGQTGFNYMDDDKLHFAGPVPSFRITRLSRNALGYTDVYFASPNLTFGPTDYVVLDVPGLEEPVLFPFDGTKHVYAATSTLVECDLLPWPVIDTGVVDLYPDNNHIWTASCIPGESSLVHTYPDIPQWSFIQVIAKNPGGTTDMTLTDSSGKDIIVAGANNGILNLTGVGFPGTWTKVKPESNIIISYRG